jgi:hypothetical protein
MLRIILVVLIVHLSGCIIIPTPEKEPYQEEQIARIHPNNTIWIYGESRHVAYGIVIFPGGWGCWFH